jgi:hypothetical protein
MVNYLNFITGKLDLVSDFFKKNQKNARDAKMPKILAFAIPFVYMAAKSNGSRFVQAHLHRTGL